MPEGWSYATFVAKNTASYSLDQILNAYGDEGWDLVTSLSTVKTWFNISGNDLVFVFKRPGAGHRPSNDLMKMVTGADPSAAY